MSSKNYETNVCKHGKVDSSWSLHMFKWKLVHYNNILMLNFVKKDHEYFKNTLIYKAKQFMLTKTISKEVYIF